MTCLNWYQDKKISSIENAHASFIEISINVLVIYFLRINLVKFHISYIKKRNNLSRSRFILDKMSQTKSLSIHFFLLI